MVVPSGATLMKDASVPEATWKVRALGVACVDHKRSLADAGIAIVIKLVTKAMTKPTPNILENFFFIDFYFSPNYFWLY